MCLFTWEIWNGPLVRIGLSVQRVAKVIVSVPGRLYAFWSVQSHHAFWCQGLAVERDSPHVVDSVSRSTRACVFAFMLRGFLQVVGEFCPFSAIRLALSLIVVFRLVGVVVGVFELLLTFN